MDKLPVFEMVINKDEESDVEVSFVALVDRPAIERNFLAFNAQERKYNFSVNEERKIISGPAMVANQLIYRADDTGEYNVYFSADTVREIAVKFFKKDYQKNLNLFHDPNLSLEGVTIFESFVSDKTRGIQPMKGYEDLPDGTWFISAKVDNEEVWNKIKAGEVKGFSVEGIFGFVKPLSRTQQHESHLLAENEIMSEIKDLWNSFKEKFLSPVVPATDPAAPAAPQSLTTARLKDGTEVQVDKLEPGGVVMIGEAPAPAGEHTLEDGTVIVLSEGGVIEAVKPVEMPEEDDMGAKFAAIESRFNEVVSAYDAKFAAQEQQTAAFAEQLTKANDTITGLVSLVEKLIETPTAESVVKTQGFNTDKKAGRVDRIKQLAETLKSLKNK